MLADETHRGDLEDHFHSEEHEDGVVERLEYSTTQCYARNVVTRLKHAESHAVQQDDTHADSLEPRTAQTTVKEQLIILYITAVKFIYNC